MRSAGRLAQPKRPLVAIVGGAKVSTKLTLSAALARKVDALVVGGGIANTSFSPAVHIGKSLAEPDLVGEAKAILDASPGKLPLPVDVVTARERHRDGDADAEGGRRRRRRRPILDIGPQSILALRSLLAGAGTIVWNGPVGVFEFDAFAAGTRALALAIAEVARLLDRRRRRHDGRDQQVRHRQANRLHLHRRRRVPRVSRGQDPAGGGGPGATRAP